MISNCKHCHCHCHRHYRYHYLFIQVALNQEQVVMVLDTWDLECVFPLAQADFPAYIDSLARRTPQRHPTPAGVLLFNLPLQEISLIQGEEEEEEALPNPITLLLQTLHHNLIIIIVVVEEEEQE